MAIKQTAKQINVTARIVSVVEIPIAADTFEAACEAIKKLQSTDFIAMKGDHLTGSMRIVSLATPDAWDSE